MRIRRAAEQAVEFEHGEMAIRRRIIALLCDPRIPLKEVGVFVTRFGAPAETSGRVDTFVRLSDDTVLIVERKTIPLSRLIRRERALRLCRLAVYQKIEAVDKNPAFVKDVKGQAYCR